jgi:peroxiredoxin
VYCHTCQEHADLLNHITQEYQEEGVRVLAVALGNDQEEVDEFVETYGVKYPILADPDMVTARLYGIREVPTVYLIDGFGTVRYRGFPDRHGELEDELDYVFDGHDGELEAADVAADAALTDL